MNNIDKLIKELCPNGVEWKELGKIGKFYGGLSGKNKDDFQNGNAKFATYMNIFSNISLETNISSLVRINENERQNIIEYGDVLFTGSSETPDECGMSSVLTEKVDEPIYLNSFCFGFRLNNKEILLPDFAKYLFRDVKIRKQISKTASGVTRYNISKKRFAKITIPIPPLPIQQEVVRILDKFTALEAELQAELEARRKQYEYYREKLLTFSEIETSRGGVSSLLSASYAEWKTLGELIISIKTGLNPRKNFKLNSSDANNFYVTVRELNTTDIIFTDKTDRVNDNALKLINNRSNLEKGDILFSGTGTIGRTALLKEKPKNWNIKEGIYVLKPNQKIINSTYLLHFLNSEMSRKQVESKTVGLPVRSIPMGEFVKILIPLPSFSEQNRIVGILDKFEELVNQSLPTEIEARRKQYEYYREKLLTFA